MGQFSKVAIDNVHTVPQRALDCRPGLGVLETRFKVTGILPYWATKDYGFVGCWVSEAAQFWILQVHADHVACHDVLSVYL